MVKETKGIVTEKVAKIEQAEPAKTFYYYEIELDAEKALHKRAKDVDFCSHMVHHSDEQNYVIHHDDEQVEIESLKYGWYEDTLRTYEQVLKDLEGTKGISIIKGFFKVKEND